METKTEWYKKLAKKLQRIKTGELDLDAYIKEVDVKIENGNEALGLGAVRLSLPSDAEIHSMADEVSLRSDTRDRMIHAMGLEQGATWVRNNIRDQLGSDG